MRKSNKNGRKFNWSIIGFFSVILMILSFGVITLFSSLKYIKSNEYEKSYNVRFEFDAYSTENPTTPHKSDADFPKNQATIDEYTKKMQKLATSFSSTLLDKGISSGNVYPEVYFDENDKLRLFLNASINNLKVASSDPEINKDDRETKKFDITPSNMYYNTVDNNRFTIIYSDGYKIDKKADDDDENPNNFHADIDVGKDFERARLYMWDINGGITDDNSKISLSPSKKKIYIRLDNRYSFGEKIKDEDTYTKNSIKDIFYTAAQDDSEEEESVPFMYIIRNLRGMINEIQYISYITKIYKNIDDREKCGFSSPEDFKRIRDSYFQLSTDQILLGEYVNNNATKFKYEIEKHGIGEFAFDEGGQYGFQNDPYSVLNIENNFARNEVNANNNLTLINNNNFACSNIFSIFQTMGTIENPQPGKSTSVTYTFLKKYIIGVVNKENYLDYLPDKNPSKSSVDSDGKWLVLNAENNEQFTASQLKKHLAENASEFPLLDIAYPSFAPNEESIKNINRNGLLSNLNVSEITPNFNKSVLSISSLLTSIICLVVFALIVGIIISILYRVPGFVAFTCNLLPASLLFLISIFSGFGITYVLFIAAFCIFALGSINSILILNKLKKQVLSHKTMNQAIIAGFSKSFFISLDLHVVTLLLGISMLFFNVGSILVFGLSLIISSLISFAFVYGINFLINMSLYCNSFGMYKFNWLTREPSNYNSLDINPKYISPLDKKIANIKTKGFDDDNYVSKLKFVNKFNLSGKSLLLHIGIFLILVVIGISIFILFGYNSFDFSGGTRIMVQNLNGITKNQIIDLLISLGYKQSFWHSIRSNVDFFSLETTHTFTINQIESIRAVLINLTGNGGSVYVQSINPTFVIDLTKIFAYVISVYVALMTVYLLVRYNWFVIVPSLIYLIINVASIVALLISTRLQVNVYVIYSFIMLVILNYGLLLAMLSSILNKWVKKNPFVYIDLQNIIKYQINIYNDNQLLFIIIALCLPVLNILFMPSILLYDSIVLLLGVIITIVALNHIFPMILYGFMNLYNAYRIKVKTIQANTEKRNFDKIDEDLIDTINCNTKNSK